MKNKKKIPFPSSCVSLEQLELYITGQLSGDQLNQVMDHLWECSFCSRQFKILKEGFVSSPNEFETTFSASKDVPLKIQDLIAETGGGLAEVSEPQFVEPSPGQLWSTVSESRIIVLLPEEETEEAGGKSGFRVAPISWEIDYASDLDLIVKEKDSPFKMAFMVEIWNQVLIRHEKLNQCWGSISSDQMEALELLQKKARGQEVKEQKLNIGPPIQDLRDERLYFQNLERRALLNLGEEPPSYEEEEEETAEEKVPSLYSLSGVSAAFLANTLKLNLRKASRTEDFKTRSFLLELAKIYRNYLKPILPIMIGFGAPVVTHLLFRKLVKKIDESKAPADLKPSVDVIKGLSYCGLGKWESAVMIFAGAMAHPATLFAGLIFSAWVLTRMGKFNEAKEKFEKAKKLSSGEQTFKVDFKKIEKFIEEERQAEFKDWFDNTIQSYVFKETSNLLSSGSK